MRMIKNRFRNIGSSIGRQGGDGATTRDVRVDNLRERFAGSNRGPAPLTSDDLAAGIAAGELFLEYQPMLDWRLGRIAGAEALVRWHHPMHGDVPPARFIALASDARLARSLTDWVIASAAGQAMQWRADGLSLEVSVNLSGRDLEDADLPDRVERLCQNAALDTAFLTLELPEPEVTIAPAQIIDRVTRLHLSGVKLSIEDFGRCYASLVQLQTVPFAAIRVDLAFVTQMMNDADCRAIVETLIDVGHDLGLTSIAEGVEDDELLKTLIELGCDRVQGNYISRPIAGDMMPAFVREFESHTVDDGRSSDPMPAAGPAGGGGGNTLDGPDLTTQSDVRPLYAAGGFSR
ncbi:MAG TPA: EAL domain-containing protein [Stellaceae bacterium]|jgi:EAL domain-containing protein (putative c-di-GMP-specific phosphodiesterase class I)|nr:EAL domain-containing protein [Stellaceae bacterium]